MGGGDTESASGEEDSDPVYILYIEILGTKLEILTFKFGCLK